MNNPIELQNAETLKKAVCWVHLRQKCILVRSLALVFASLATASSVLALDPPPDGA
jgi:hypothetical protein